MGDFIFLASFHIFLDSILRSFHITLGRSSYSTTMAFWACPS